MNVRIVNHLDDPLITGVLGRVWCPPASTAAVEIQRVGIGGQWTRAHRGLCSVTVPEGTRMPLWYGGSYIAGTHLDFSLPDGHHNIWGCGNYFDTDAFKIHLEDVALLNAMLELI